MMFLWIFLSLFSLASPADMVAIQKQCGKTYKKDAKNICGCVKNNLRKKLSDRQLKQLAKIYQNPAARIAATKNQMQKAILELDYEIHKNCSHDPDWKLLEEDLGKPDPLEN